MKRRDFIKSTMAAAVSLSPLSKLACSAPPTDEFIRLDALAQAELVRKGEVSARELVQAAIRRIETLNPQLNAVITKLFDRALEKAEGPLPEGPFAGVPYLLKDLVEYAGVRLTFGSVAFQNNISEVTPPLVAAEEKAGLIIMGKTNTPEFGLLPATESTLLGPARNPWNPEYSPGGSSGGAAVAVASGMLPMAQASDGGGSIRIPASNCGLFGLKVSRGRTMYIGRKGPGELSVFHCVSRSVRDSAALLRATNDPANGLPAPTPEAGSKPGALRIAMATLDMYGNKPHPECEKAVHESAKLCESLGHHVEEANLSFDGEQFVHHFLTLWSSIPAGIIAQITQATGSPPPAEAFEPWTWGLAELYKTRKPNAMQEALQFMAGLTRQVAAFHEKYDIFLTPVLASPPPKIGYLAPTVEFDELMKRVLSFVTFTPIANATGIPAMSVPLHWTGDGLPVGSHFSAKLGAEAKLLSLAFQLEEARPWVKKWAPLSAVKMM